MKGSLYHRPRDISPPWADTLSCVLCGVVLQLGDAYHSLLDLPCDLSPSNGRSLDEQLQLLHGVISRAFRQSGLSAYDSDMGDEEMGG